MQIRRQFGRGPGRNEVSVSRYLPMSLARVKGSAYLLGCNSGQCLPLLIRVSSMRGHTGIARRKFDREWCSPDLGSGSALFALHSTRDGNNHLSVTRIGDVGESCFVQSSLWMILAVGDRL